MTLEYDRDADALAIVIADDGLVSRTDEIDSGTLVDIDEHGRVLVIEVIRPARPWPVDTIIERYALDDADVAVLRGLGGTPALEFAEAATLAVA